MHNCFVRVHILISIGTKKSLAYDDETKDNVFHLSLHIHTHHTTTSPPHTHVPPLLFSPARPHTTFTPTQRYGTWLYGRDGWCNGRPVTPWSADVTKATVPGETVTLSYRALYCTIGPHEGGYECNTPDPGPPSTWSQSPPVMMPAIYVAFEY